MNATSDEPGRRCQWCSTAAAESDTHCAACGAALAQREKIGDLVIPGVTHVDPGLKQYAAQPLRIPGPSPTQYVAGPAVGAVVTMGPAGLVALAGLGAVAATEYAGAGRGELTQADLEKLGHPSEAVLQMVKQLEEEPEAEPAQTEGTPTEPEDGADRS